MADSRRTHYLNADFDLSLRPRAESLRRPRIDRQVRELSTQALVGASASDDALVRAEIPDEFLEYLETHGVSAPAIRLYPDAAPERPLRPFGWNADAIALNGRLAHPVRHPPLATVRRVNGRSFAVELEARLGISPGAGTVVDGTAALEEFLSLQAPGSEWVFKAEHGNSALANRRLLAPRLDPAQRRFIDGQFAEDDRGVVEPWRRREQDWSAHFDVPFDASRYRVHELTSTGDGALIGTLYGSCRFPEPAWEQRFRETAEQVARELEAAGYFGPVCMDGFSWTDGETTTLRPLVDLNCRHSVNDGAHRLWTRLLPERTVFYRFYNRRKVDLPDEQASAVGALGERRYDPERRSGVLFASPLTLGSGAERWSSSKLAVLFAGPDRETVLDLDLWFRARFET